MNALLLRIKGDRAAALAALDAHGIHPLDRLTQVTTFESPPPVKSGYVISLVTVKAECEPGVVRWFCEPPASATTFAAGTLLLYSEVQS